MKLKCLGMALVGTIPLVLAQAAPAEVYDSATFTAVGGGNYQLDGLERSNTAFGQFLDTWNINVSDLAPGTYGFDPIQLEAVGVLNFEYLNFNSIDEAGVRRTFLFDRNATGTQILGSGTFIVRDDCPLVSCVWMDIITTQAAEGGYAGTGLATLGSSPGGTPSSVYDTALFTAVGGGTYELDGFERGNTAFGQFLDTWNISVPGLAPGTYGLENFFLEALGELTFSNVSFNSIDEAGVRHTFLFDQNATGTQVIGSGSFTVRENCPLVSCIWMDINVTQAGEGGYIGTGFAIRNVPIPEPGSALLLVLGLTASLATARRKGFPA